jgi:hypothetical protein
MTLLKTASIKCFDEADRVSSILTSKTIRLIAIGARLKSAIRVVDFI